jgi:hypothetical protein
MAATLKWDGDELKLGATKMAEMFTSQKNGAPLYFYVLGPRDTMSEPYQSKDDARQDCFNEVQRLLRKAGV